MADLELLEELILEVGLELDQVDTILSRQHTTFDAENIYELDLSGLGLTFLPDLISEFVALEELDLSNNAITVLPANLVTLPNLERVYLYNNPIDRIPDALIPILDVFDMENYKLPTQNRSQSNTMFIRVHSEEEKKQVEMLLDIYRSRRCCTLSGRLSDTFCTICGRVIPEEMKP